MVRSQVRKRNGRWEVWVLKVGARAWEPTLHFPTWWQAMLQVTGDLPYGSETRWTLGLRPLWV